MLREVNLKYTGSTPGADTNTYTLLNSTTAFSGANFMATFGKPRLLLSIMNNQAGTLKVYRSSDRGTTWTQCMADIAVSAVASNTANFYDLLLAEYPDIKVDWVNGGSAQTTWYIDMALGPLTTKVT